MQNDQTEHLPVGLRAHLTPGARCENNPNGGWRLFLPPGRANEYHLAQLDDYSALPRRKFAHTPPLTLEVNMRASHAQPPGTWGFGLWNDPFAMNLLIGRGGMRLPVLPQAAWFFFAASECYLSLRDDLPANGALAATFHSKKPISFALFQLVSSALLFPWRAARRWMRRRLRAVVTQDAVGLNLDPRRWHTYVIHWEKEMVHFEVNGETVLQTGIVPRAPLGLVIWVDNQYAAWHPDGRMRYGFLPHPKAFWMEFSHLRVERK